MFRTGLTTIGSSGATSVSVSFGATFSTIPTSVVATVGNTADSDHLLIYPFLISKSTTGCTFELSGAVDSTNYSISWTASDADNVTGVTGGSSVPAKAFNKLPAVSSISNYDWAFISVQSTSGGIPTTYRISLNALKSFLNS
jgi:hypothetical protein